jgi:serine/threonine protein kinase
MNVLVDENEQACLTDFGLTLVGNGTAGQYSTHSKALGSARWMGPERLDPALETARLLPSTDVWAFGCLCVSVCLSTPLHIYCC